MISFSNWAVAMSYCFRCSRVSTPLLLGCLGVLLAGGCDDAQPKQSTTTTVITTESGKNSSKITINGIQQPMTKGSGNVTTEERDVSDFRSIDVAGSASVSIVPGDFSCTITTDDNIHEHITTEVANDTLVVATKGSYSSNGVNLKISMPELNAVSTSGSGGIHFEEFDSKTVTATSAGSASIGFKGCQFGKLVAGVTGSGSVKGSGTATLLVVNVTGSGSAMLGEVSAVDVQAKATGSGYITVSPTNTLKADSFGSGSISYKKQPNLKIEKSVLGSGAVTPR